MKTEADESEINCRSFYIHLLTFGRRRGGRRAGGSFLPAANKSL